MHNLSCMFKRSRPDGHLVTLQEKKDMCAA